MCWRGPGLQASRQHPERPGADRPGVDERHTAGRESRRQTQRAGCSWKCVFIMGQRHISSLLLLFATPSEPGKTKAVGCSETSPAEWLLREIEKERRREREREREGERVRESESERVRVRVRERERERGREGERERQRERETGMCRERAI